MPKRKLFSEFKSSSVEKNPLYNDEELEEWLSKGIDLYQSVFYGRGKATMNHAGNQTLYNLVAYGDRSSIQIISAIQSYDYEGYRGAFIERVESGLREVTNDETNSRRCKRNNCKVSSAKNSYEISISQSTNIVNESPDEKVGELLQR